jgi:hypothetical protein
MNNGGQNKTWPSACISSSTMYLSKPRYVVRTVRVFRRLQYTSEATQKSWIGQTTLTVLSLKMAVARPTQLALLTSIKGLPAAVRAATVPEHLSFLEIDPANPDLEALKSAEVGRPFCQTFCFFVLPSFFFCNGRFYQCLYLPQLIRRHNEQRVLHIFFLTTMFHLCFADRARRPRSVTRSHHDATLSGDGISGTTFLCDNSKCWPLAHILCRACMFSDYFPSSSLAPSAITSVAHSRLPVAKPRPSHV